MKYKVKDVVESLKTLPDPEYIGQILNLPIRNELPEYISESNVAKDAVVKFIVLEAQQFRIGHLKWLEWVYDV